MMVITEGWPPNLIVRSPVSQLQSKSPSDYISKVLTDHLNVPLTATILINRRV
jgi:hypothetical protein